MTRNNKGFARLVAVAVCALVWVIGVIFFVGYFRGSFLDAAGRRRISPFRTPTATRSAGNDFRGQVVILHFIYAGCPDICPLHADRIAEVQERGNRTPMESHVLFITITTDSVTEDTVRAPARKRAIPRLYRSRSCRAGPVGYHQGLVSTMRRMLKCS